MSALRLGVLGPPGAPSVASWGLLGRPGPSWASWGVLGPRAKCNTLHAKTCFFEGALWRRRRRKARKRGQPRKVAHGIGPVCAQKGPPGAWWHSSETHFTRRTSGTLANSRRSRRGSETHVTRPTAGTLENSRSSRSRRVRLEAELGACSEIQETRPTAGTLASESKRRGASEVRGEGPRKSWKLCSRVHSSKVFAQKGLLLWTLWRLFRRGVFAEKHTLPGQQRAH